MQKMTMHPDCAPQCRPMRQYVVSSGRGRWIVRAHNGLHAAEQVMERWLVMAGTARPLPDSDVIQVAATDGQRFSLQR